MKYISGRPRDQLCLFEEKLDSIIPEDHIIRFLDAYVDRLDLAKIGISISKGNKGLAYNPTLYLKIYIYSYVNKIRSSRKIERECKRNIELIWLTKQLSPDHWSISNFRKCNKEGMKNIFKEFLTFCHKLNLLSFDCIAIDGTKMRSNNSLSNVYKRDGIDKVIKHIENRIDNYISELESNDKVEQDEYEFLNQNIPKKLQQLEKHKDKLHFFKEMFEENPELKKYFANDPDSGFQKDNGRCIVGYNCQSVVDEKNKLIVATGVTTENNDLHQLNTMLGKINRQKDDFEITKKTICVSDAGYYCESEIIEVLKDNNSEVYIPHKKEVKKRGKAPLKGFERGNFTYDKEKDFFVCPQKEILTKTGSTIRNGIKKIRYECKKCKNCEHFNVCTTNKRGRTIEQSVNFEIMEKFRKKVKSDLGKKIIQKRKELVEHPFGTIKRNLGFTYFMQTGIDKVEAEFSFIAFIYNFKRVINIVGVKGLIEALE